MNSKKKSRKRSKRYTQKGGAITRPGRSAQATYKTDFVNAGSSSADTVSTIPQRPPAPTTLIVSGPQIIGYDGIVSSAVLPQYVHAMSIDSAGNLYAGDGVGITSQSSTGSSTNIIQITPSKVSLFSGPAIRNTTATLGASLATYGTTAGNTATLSKAGYNQITGMSIYNDIIYVIDTGANAVRKIYGGNVTTIVTGSSGGWSCCVDAIGCLYIKAIISGVIYIVKYL